MPSIKQSSSSSPMTNPRPWRGGRQLLVTIVLLTSSFFLLDQRQFDQVKSMATTTSESSSDERRRGDSSIINSDTGSSRPRRRDDSKVENDKASSDNDNSDNNSDPDYLPRQRQQQDEETSSTTSITAADPSTSEYYLNHPNYPLDHHNYDARNFHSTISCIGDRFIDAGGPPLWMTRSCRFHNLCLDVRSHEFVVFRSPLQQTVEAALETAHQRRHAQDAAKPKAQRRVFFGNAEHTLYSSATSFLAQKVTGGLALGGITKRWDLRTQRRLKWFPTIVDLMDPSAASDDHNHNNNTLTNQTTAQELAATLQRHGYYTLPPDITLVPFHCQKGENLGHMLWDSYLPIFHLLRIFDLVPNNDNSRPPNSSNNHNDNKILLIRYLLKENPLWGSCEGPTGKPMKCHRNFNKTLPNMWNIPYEAMLTNRKSRIHKRNAAAADESETFPQSPLVCAPTAVAGMGLLHDQGLKLHGEFDSDYSKPMHNYGKGDTLWEFRNFLLGNFHRRQGQEEQQQQSSEQPTTTSGIHNLASQQDVSQMKTVNIVFSILSSTDKKRSHDFVPQIKALKRLIADKEGDQQQQGSSIKIRSIQLANYTMPQQMTLLSEQTSILITACGGGAATSIFLPKGASLILFYNDRARTKTGPRMPARLDFDYFQNLGYLNTHWLPTSGMTTQEDLDLFATLVYSQILNLRQQQQQQSSRLG